MRYRCLKCHIEDNCSCLFASRDKERGTGLCLLCAGVPAEQLGEKKWQIEEKRRELNRP